MNSIYNIYTMFYDPIEPLLYSMPRPASFLIHRRNRGPQDHHLGADLRQDGDPQAAIRGGLRSERVHRCVSELHGPPISDLRAGGARARVGSAVSRAAGAPVDPARDAQVPALRELGAAALPLRRARRDGLTGRRSTGFCRWRWRSRWRRRSSR